MPQVRQLVNF